MNKKSYIILLITFIITGATMLCSAVRAAAETSTVQEKAASGYAGSARPEAITWTYNTDTKTLSFSGSGDMASNEGASHITDDSELEKYVPRNFGAWYLWHEEAEHIIIGEGITDIGAYAFLKFNKLEDISIPDSVLYIRTGAFMNASVFSITLPKSLKEIEREAFSFIQTKRITIPGSVKKIGREAFYSSALRKITIEDGVEEINEFAFCECMQLEEIAFPDSVKFTASDSKLYIAGQGMLVACYKLKKVTFPSTIKVIPQWFCSECYNLEEVDIPSSVKTIGAGAFGECGLKRVVIPSSVKTIGGGAFEYCYSLKRVVIPSSVKTIGEGAFEECGNLKEITIPSSVKTIGAYAFAECRSLKKVTLPKKLKIIERDTFAGTNLKSIKLPETLKEIGSSAFEYSSLKSIKLPKSLEKLDMDAFAATDIKTLEIPENVKVLSGGEFPNSKTFKSLKIKSRKIKNMDSWTFKRFPSKAVITVPKGKKKSYSKMFYKAGLSKKVKIKESKKW